METLLTFDKPVLVGIPQLYRARIVAQLLIDILEWGTPHPIDDYGLYPVLRGDYLECLDYDALIDLYQGAFRHLYLESITVTGEFEYTLTLLERVTPSGMALLGQHPIDDSQWDTVKHTLRYKAKHGAYELSRRDVRYVSKHHPE